MIGRILFECDEWLVTAGLLGGIKVVLKSRNLTYKAKTTERRHLMDTVELLKESGISVTPDNLQLQELFQTFAEAVAGRGDARWQAYFIHTTPQELARTFLESTTNTSRKEDKPSTQEQSAGRNNRQDDGTPSVATIVETFSDAQFIEIDEKQCANLAGLLQIAKERATNLSKHEDAKGRLIGYLDSTSSSLSDFEWVHIEFETSYDGEILIFRYFFPVGDLEHATLDEIENRLEENWYLKPYLRETGIRNLNKFWDKEKNEMVYELRYALGEMEFPDSISTLWYQIATEEDGKDENIRYRLKRARYASESYNPPTKLSS